MVYFFLLGSFVLGDETHAFTVLNFTTKHVKSPLITCKCVAWIHRNDKLELMCVTLGTGTCKRVSLQYVNGVFYVYIFQLTHELSFHCYENIPCNESIYPYTIVKEL